MITAEILPAQELGINNSFISDNALGVVSKIQEAGYECYLVGGCVRDLILQVKPKDFDVATNATPEQVKSLFKNSRIIGRRFKIVHIRYGREVIEVATFRANANDRDGVKAHEMTQSDEGQLTRDNVYGSIEEDVVRRDFSVNSMYYDPVKSEVHDFMGGYADLRAKLLRSIGDPEQRFTEDPVRMLRIIRFAAKLDFTMQPEALVMIENSGKLLSHVSSARLFEEVLKLFHGGAAFDTYKMLVKYGLFKYLFPFTEQCIVEGIEGMPELALQNTDKRIKAGKPVIPAFLFACMMWDPVKRDAQTLMDDGASDSQAWRVAMSDALRDQNQYVAVPRRLAEIILDIWNIHFRLIKRNPRMVKTSMGNRRFRAAYDFLLLRAKLHEVEDSLAQWWTQIQEVSAEAQDEMIEEVSKNYKNDRRHQTGEANGNSVNYNSNSNSNGNSYANNGYGLERENTAPKRAMKGRKKPTSGGRSNQSRRAGQGQAGGGNGANTSRNNRNGGKTNRFNGRSSSRSNTRNGRRNPNNPGAQANPQARLSDENQYNATPEKQTEKKVKVRKKRRIVKSPDKNDVPNDQV